METVSVMKQCYNLMFMIHKHRALNHKVSLDVWDCLKISIFYVKNKIQIYAGYVTNLSYAWSYFLVKVHIQHSFL